MYQSCQSIVPVLIGHLFKFCLKFSSPNDKKVFAVSTSTHSVVVAAAVVVTVVKEEAEAEEHEGTHHAAVQSAMTPTMTSNFAVVAAANSSCYPGHPNVWLQS